MDKNKIKENLVQGSKSGIFPSYLLKHFFDEIQKANDNGFTLENVVFARAVYGDVGGFIYPANADKYKTHDFYFIEMSGIVSRWFPGIEISELKQTF